MNVTDGKRVLVSDPIEVSDEKRRRYFDARIRQGQLYFDWFNSYQGEHAARMDVKTGRVTRFPKDAQMTRHQSTRDYFQIAKITADAESMGVNYELPADVARKLEDPKPRELFEGPRAELHFRKRWIVGNVLALHLKKEDEGTTRELLVCWDLKTGKHLHSVECEAKEYPRAKKGPSEPPPKGREIEYYVGLDFNGRYMVCYKTLWYQLIGSVKVLSVQSGEWLPTVHLVRRNEPDIDGSAKQVHAVGPRLFYAILGKEKSPGDKFHPATLKARDIATERVLWERRVGPIFSGRSNQ